MSGPEPFAYPQHPHERLHGPRGYTNYGSYKDWLRDEFAFRCVYCLEREQWYPDRSDSFSVDHVVPQSVDPARICDYDNLVYACTRCNSALRDVNHVDLTQTVLGHHLEVSDNGSIQALTTVGADLIETLGLHQFPAIKVRRYYLKVAQLARKYPDDPDVRELVFQSFRYPEDLPDLSLLRPPGGNFRPEGILRSHHARRVRGVLPDVM
jgi:hypothetical protein